ncbi:hypothetical protein Bca101_088557 [Brassica carinata]
MKTDDPKICNEKIGSHEKLQNLNTIMAVTLTPATISANRVPTLSSSVGEKEIEFVCLKKGKEKLNKATRIPSFILMKTSRKIINQGVPTSFSCQGRSDRLEGFQPTLGSKGVKKIYKQCEKMGSNSKRLFGEKDEIVLLQGIIDSKGKNPLEDRLYES